MWACNTRSLANYYKSAKFLLIETSYHPFISLFHLRELIKQDPTLAVIRKS
jgi:hypothetical protein